MSNYFPRRGIADFGRKIGEERIGLYVKGKSACGLWGISLPLKGVFHFDRIPIKMLSNTYPKGGWGISGGF